MRKLHHRPVALTLVLTTVSIAVSVAITVGVMHLVGMNDLTIGVALGALLPATMAPVPTFLLARSADRLRRMQAELEHLANTDSLTGLPNRRRFFAVGDHLLHEGGSRPSAVMMVDLDRFKWVNDTFGHAVGDDVLQMAARVIAGAVPAALRPSSIVARVGGEEFALVIAGIEPGKATALADQICAGIRAASVNAGDDQVTITASLGVGTVETVTDIDTALRAADEASYRAKRLGGDCWVRVRPNEPGVVLHQENRSRTLTFPRVAAA